MINVNVCSLTYVTKILIPKMLDSGHKTGIVNFGSMVHNLYMPKVAVFAATKGYMGVFSQNLNRELKGQIDVLYVKPTAIKTKNQFFTGLWVISPASHARSTLKKLGWDSETFGHPKHAI